MIEKINPTIPIPIESSSIPDEQRVITIAKSNIAIPNPIFFTVNPSFENSDLFLNFVFKLYHKTCEQFYRNFGLYEKSPNSFLPGLSLSIINQFRFHNFLCLCLASVHLPHPFHLVFGFQLFGHAVALHQLRHDQLHAISCRFVNLGAILSYVHPAMAVLFFAVERQPPAWPVVVFYSGFPLFCRRRRLRCRSK